MNDGSYMVGINKWPRQMTHIFVNDFCSRDNIAADVISIPSVFD